MKLIRYIFLSFLFAVLFFSAERASAQLILTPQNMGMGGGGTAYLTGPEALFVNPANLRIQESSYNIRVTLINGGIFYDELFPETFGFNRFARFLDINQYQTSDGSRKRLTDDISDKLIEGNYGERQRTKTTIHKADLHWFGLKWIRPERSYAIAVRSRFSNKFEVGRGLFTTSSFNEGSTVSRNQFFSHTIQALHEISFGFGESFTYLNGQYPGLSEFIIGIAPKIVIPGSFQDVTYDRDFTLETASGNWQSIREFRQISAGGFKTNAQSFFNNLQGAPGVSMVPPSLRDMLQPSGFGFGLDAGITYLITLGDDLSLLRDSNNPTQKSLRLSLSVTDLGFTIYNSEALRYKSDTDTIVLQESPSVSEYIYEGIPEEHYFFLDQFSDFNSLDITEESEPDLKVSLPTSMQAGAVFQYNRFKAVADISYSVMESAFTSPGLSVYTGLELRPLPSFPLRAGSGFAKDMPGFISFGTGIETGTVNLNTSVMIRNRGTGYENELLAVSALGLTFFF